MKIYIIFLSLLFAVLSDSCRKENYEIDVKSDVPKIRKIIIADLPFYQYSYNNEDIISEEISNFNFTDYNYNTLDQLVTTDYYSDKDLLGNDQQVLENALDRKGLLNIADSEKGGTLKYEYDIYGQLKNSEFSNPAGSNHEYSEFTYDVNGRLGRQTLLWEN